MTVLRTLLCATLLAPILIASLARAADPQGSPGAANEPASPAATATPQSIALVRSGTTPFAIDVRSPKETAVQFAAKELARYLAQMSGATLATGDAPSAGPRIVLGLRTDLSDADRALLPQPAKGFDGYAIHVGTAAGGEPRIVIGADVPRAAVYAVYDLLERLGCRFVHPTLDPADPEVVPSSKDLSLASGAWSVASPMRYRVLAWFEWRKPNPDKLATTPEELAAQIDWAMKARYNSFETPAVEVPPEHRLARAVAPAKERGMMLQAPGHNFELFLPTSPKALAEHPEWFGAKNGKRVGHGMYGAQFCWTNEGARKEFADNIVEFLRARPDIDILELSGIDGGNYAPSCACDVCSKRSPTDNVIEMLNGVVERLAKEAPNVVVETLGGYQYSARPPREVKPDPRLRVFWAHWGRPATFTYSDESYPRRKQLETWAKAFDNRLTVFQYYSDHFANPWLTPPLTKQIDGDRSYLVELGIDGMLNLVYSEGFWWRSSLNGYLAGRSFYDPKVDPLVILREYALSYYGPAGELMAAYLEEWAKDPELGLRSRDESSQANRDTLAAQRKKYLDPAAALVTGVAPYANRVAKTESLHRLAEAIMDVDVARREAKAAHARGDAKATQAAVESTRTLLEAASQLATSMIDPRRGLIDAEIEPVIFRHKRTVLASEAKELGFPFPAPPPVVLPLPIPTASGAAAAPSAAAAASPAAAAAR